MQKELVTLYTLEGHTPRRTIFTANCTRHIIKLVIVMQEAHFCDLQITENRLILNVSFWLGQSTNSNSIQQ